MVVKYLLSKAGQLIARTISQIRKQIKLFTHLNSFNSFSWFFIRLLFAYLHLHIPIIFQCRLQPIYQW